MTTTDTRAALDAATLALIDAATEEGKAWGLHSLPTGGDSTYGDYTRANEARGNAEDDVKTAIAAHVAAELARALAAVAHALAATPSVEVAIAKLRNGFDPRDEEVTDLRHAIAADKARAVIESRPTPDEARRLVGDLVRALTGGVVRFPPSYGKTVAAKAIDDARAALLRALGVES